MGHLPPPDYTIFRPAGCLIFPRLEKIRRLRRKKLDFFGPEIHNNFGIRSGSAL